MPRKKTHLEFIVQANKIHNNKYKYVDTYIGDSIKISIICPIHGNFKQVPSSHLQGCGCPKCAETLRSKLFIKNNEFFVKKAKNIHNNFYTYPEEYKGSHVKINIVCPVHGDFKQTPDKHLHGNGCPICGGTKKKSKDEFVSEAIVIHNNKYKYPGIYKNARTNIEIECPKHGIFLQIPNVHLNGSGCPTCSSNSSKPEMKWLDSLGIPNDNLHRHCKIYIDNFHIKPDGFDSSTKTIYEFYGDYFHGNPKKYDPNEINHKNKKTFGELYRKTLEREEMIRKAGYNFIYIWESDWKINGKQNN